MTTLVCFGAVYVVLNLFDKDPFQCMVTRNNFRSSLGDLKIICGKLRSWVLAPHFVVPSLLGPIRFARNTFA